MGVEGFTWDVSKNEESAKNLFAAFQRAERERVLAMLDAHEAYATSCKCGVKFSRDGQRYYAQWLDHVRAALSQPPEVANPKKEKP